MGGGGAWQVGDSISFYGLLCTLGVRLSIEWFVRMANLHNCCTFRTSRKLS